MKAGERAVRHQAAAAAVADVVDPHDRIPGETGRELSGTESISALHDALLDITGEPRVKFGNVKDIEVKKVGRWVVITVKHKGKDTNTLTFRVGAGWAAILKNRLRTVLEP